MAPKIWGGGIIFLEYCQVFEVKYHETGHQILYVFSFHSVLDVRVKKVLISGPTITEKRLVLSLGARGPHIAPAISAVCLLVYCA